MKEYLLTITEYGGHGVFEYDEEGKLLKFENCFDAVAENTLSYILRRCVTLDSMKEMTTTGGVAGKLRLEPLVREISFEQMYNDYNLKEKRQRAENSWKLLSKSDRYLAHKGIGKYEQKLLRNPVPKCHLATYLNEKRWND